MRVCIVQVSIHALAISLSCRVSKQYCWRLSHTIGPESWLYTGTTGRPVPIELFFDAGYHYNFGQLARQHSKTRTRWYFKSLLLLVITRIDSIIYPRISILVIQVCYENTCILVRPVYHPQWYDNEHNLCLDCWIGTSDNESSALVALFIGDSRMTTFVSSDNGMIKCINEIERVIDQLIRSSFQTIKINVLAL